MPSDLDGDPMEGGSLRPGWGYAPQAVGEGTVAGAIAPTELPPDAPTSARAGPVPGPTDPPRTRRKAALWVWLAAALLIAVLGCALSIAATPVEPDAEGGDPLGQAIGLALVVVGLVIAVIGLIRGGLDPWRLPRPPASGTGGRAGQ